MAFIQASDESGRTWTIVKGDPGWDAANHAKQKLLLDSPVLPISVILTGQPDELISQVHQEMQEYLKVVKLVGAESQRTIWPGLRRKFRAWKTQQGVFGDMDVTVGS